MNTNQVMLLLKQRHPAPVWAFLPECRRSTGSTNTTADAVAMSLWKSRGLEIHGFEIKVSRSDRLRELKCPDKADEICRFCDRWWIVAGDDHIIKAGELPPTWGLLAVRGNKLMLQVQAPKLEAEPFDRKFLAAVFRKFDYEFNSQPDNTASQIEDARREEFERARQQGQQRYDTLQNIYNAQNAQIRAFEQTSGLSLNRYGPARIGEAVRLVLNGGDRILKARLLNLESVAAGLLFEI